MFGRYKYGRYLTIAAVLVLAACGTTKTDGEMDSAAGQGLVASDMEGVYVENQNAAPGTKDDFVINVGDRVLFGYDMYDLSAEARSVLENQAAWLSQYPSIMVSIEGHADERGTREYNLALGERRANSVKNYLVALGISPSRISTVSYGKERPAVPGSNEEAWAQNRRAVTAIQ